MTEEHKSRRQFENIIKPEDIPDKIDLDDHRKKHGYTYLPEPSGEISSELVEDDQEPEDIFQHGNIFDHGPFSRPPAKGKMVSKRLKDEGF